MKYTLGCELELADIDTRISIPGRLGSWDYKDGSICNSNGAANDPKKILNRYGGEIQVTPTTSPGKLLGRVQEILALFPRKQCNFTTNLHVHISVPGLREDLESLKRIARYFRLCGTQMFEAIDPLLPPVCPCSDEGCKGAWKRYKRRKRSHHYQVSDKVYTAMLKATSPSKFNLAHVNFDAKGLPQWQFVVRAGVNLAHLWKNNTIEFRCFTMSFNAKKLLSAFRWPELFLTAALNRNPPSLERILLKNPDLSFQRFFDYDCELDKIFQMTNVYHQSRAKAKRNYDLLFERGVLRREDVR